MLKLVLVCLVAVASAALAEQGYTDRFDNVDVDEILHNRRLLIPYVKCMLDQGKCVPEARELKSHIKEALENNCGKCNAHQKENVRKAISHLINEEPDYWRQLVNKYDPQHKQQMRVLEADQHPRAHGHRGHHARV